MRFPAELRAVLARVLGEEPPEPEGEPVAFFRQWLAERNLGLVPVADATSFAWAGDWIAQVRGDGDHAVLMFGSPSGPVYDPAGAIAAGGTIVQGWVVARLDLHLPAEEPYGAPAAAGTVAGLLVAPEAEAPLVRLGEATALEGRGLDGDRYAAGRGTFGGARGYQLTLVEAEALEEVGLGWEEARRNVVTRGVRLNALVGRRFRVGEVECAGRRLAEPCAHLERLTRPGLLRPLVHRAGLRADILAGGTIRVGDTVTPL
jgi:hypothetical protein